MTAKVALVVSFLSLIVSLGKLVFDASQALPRLGVVSWIENRSSLFSDTSILHLRVTNLGPPTTVNEIGFDMIDSKGRRYVRLNQEHKSLFDKRLDRNECFEVTYSARLFADIPIGERKLWRGFYVETSDTRRPYSLNTDVIASMMMIEYK